jgi:hypothetical protein
MVRRKGSVMMFLPDTELDGVLCFSLIVLLLVSSCATVPTDPLASGELRLLSMHVPMKEDIRVNFPFVVNINFEADGKPEIRTACFSFSGDGPYCFKVTDVNYGSPGTIKVQVRAKNSGSHALESYVLYIKDGKIQPTNIIGCQIRVIP